MRASLWAGLESDRLFAMYVLAIKGGLRQGEIFGLQWSDVEYDAVLVQRSLDRKTGLGRTKTGGGRRRVDLPVSAIEALDRPRERMAAEGHGSSYIFCDTDSGPLRNPNVTRR